jgi:hypothetical protein
MAAKVRLFPHCKKSGGVPHRTFFQNSLTILALFGITGTETVVLPLKNSRF